MIRKFLLLTFPIIFFVVSCGAPAPLRQRAYPIDCKKGQPIKVFLQRGDVHRNHMMRERPPEKTDPERWVKIRKIHGSRAQTCYQLVLDTKSDHAYALMNQGFLKLVESTFPDQEEGEQNKLLLTATNYVQKALEAQQLDAQAYYYLAEIAARQGQCDKALRILNALLTSGWSYSHVYAWIGHCQETMKKIPQAQAAYKKAAELSNPIGVAEWARLKIQK